MSVRPQAKDKPSAASFKWDDPFLLDEQLTEDERMIRDTARAYAQEKLLPRVIKAYLEEKTDREIFNEMGELGLIGVTLGVTNLADTVGNRFALGTPFRVGRGQITPLRPRTVRLGLDAAF